MFILSNSYQLRNTKKDIFDLHFTADVTISHFISLDGYHVLASKADLYSLKKGKIKKIAGFREDITALSKQQGLICAGTLHGEVRVFSEHRSAIRQFKLHEAEITDIIITADRTVISASKDCTVSFYDLVGDKLLGKISLGGRPRKLLESSKGVVVFTKDIEIYSPVDFKLVKRIEFGSPVDCAAVLSDRQIVLTSKNSAFIFDLEDGCVKLNMPIHVREVVSVQVYANKIYTCSVDGHFKSHTDRLKTVNDFTFGCRLASFSIVNGVPFVATEGGKIYTIETTATVQEQRRKLTRIQPYEDEIDYKVIQKRKQLLSEVNKLLGNFFYKEAVKKCLRDNELEQTYAVLRHIYDERMLARLMKDLDVDFLKSIVLLCLETVKIPEFTPIITEILLIMTSTYTDELVGHEELEGMLELLSAELNEVVAFEEIYLKAVSFVESFSLSEGASKNE